MTTSIGVNVREVTDVDRRTAKRLGMSPETVNVVIQAWADEYLAYEKQNASLAAATRPEPPKPPAKKAAAKKAAPKRTAKAAAKPPTTGESGPSPMDGHGYIPIDSLPDADCLDCGAKEGAHITTQQAEQMAGDKN